MLEIQPLLRAAFITRDIIVSGIGGGVARHPRCQIPLLRYWV